jgi:CRP-like cAMP-binding protein
MCLPIHLFFRKVIKPTTCISSPQDLFRSSWARTQAQPQELARLAEGDHFGEQGFLAMNKAVRTASVQTLEPTRLLLGSGKTFKKVIAKSA